MTEITPTPASARAHQTLARLAWKYDTLTALRAARERGEPLPARAVFRDLAAEFPGCLVELDTLSPDALHQRTAALHGALAGAEVEPWMRWLAGYHGLLRAALWLKPRVLRDPPEGAAAEQLARDASAASGVTVDAAFVRGVACPPGGRLVALVYAALAEAHGRPVAELRRALFPRARR